MKKHLWFWLIPPAILLLLLGGLGVKKNEGSSRILTELASLGLAMERYKIDNGHYPQGSSADIASALLGQDGTPYVEWKNGAKEGFILDPWGRPYLFSYLPDGTPQIVSLGKDGVPSTDDCSLDTE